MFSGVFVLSNTFSSVLSVIVAAASFFLEPLVKKAFYKIYSYLPENSFYIKVPLSVSKCTLT